LVKILIPPARLADRILDYAIKPKFDHASWRTRHNRKIWNILIDKRIGADDGTVADFDAAANDRVRTDPNVMSDRAGGCGQRSIGVVHKNGIR